MARSGRGPSPRRIRASRRSTSPCRAIPSAGPTELGAEILPTGTLRRRSGGLVDALPGYDEGAWWVQDAAAALPALLLGEVKGRRVLDIGAAPGGKTAQLAAMGAKVTALERSPKRAEFLVRNLGRLALDAEIVVADALEWQAPAPFDADPARRALHRHRHHPPPSRRALGQVAGRRRAAGRSAGPAARGRGRHARARRRAGLCRLLAAARGGPAADRGPARGRRAGRARSRSPRPSSRACRCELTPPGEVRTLPCDLAASGGMDGFFIARLRRGAPERQLGDRPMPFRPIRRALLSVHDKTGLVELGRRARRPRASSWSRPAAPPRPCARPACRWSRSRDLTGAPEILDGRVKTLHPGVHGGHPGAARRPGASGRRWRSTASPPIDLVVGQPLPVRGHHRVGRRLRRLHRADRRRRPGHDPRRGQEP